MRQVGPTALVALSACLCLGVASALSTASNCTGSSATWGQTRDTGKFDAVQWLPCWATGSDDDSATFAQLFTVPSLPFVLTRVCTVLASMQTVETNATAEVAMWSASLNSSTGLLQPHALMASRAESIWCRAKDGVMQGVNVSFLLREDRSVFVGIRVRPCMAFGMLRDLNSVNAVTTQRRQMSPFYRPEVGRAMAIRVQGEPGARDVPSSWTCNETRYWDSAVCDCGCGSEDPDCLRVGRVSPDCGGANSGQICFRGVCVTHGWNTSKLGCNTSLIATDGVCQCGCGERGSLVDPDCWDPAVPVDAAICDMLAPKCTSAGLCVERWTCDASLFGDRVNCTCGCGAPDPDCEDSNLPNTCQNDFACHNGVCDCPRSWTCSPALYADGENCHCECGTYDPDCDWVTSVRNCAAYNEVCNYTGLCITPKCPNGHADAGEECDGGAGCNTQSCACLKGFAKHVPLRPWCDPICGDRLVLGSEQCDSSAFCDMSSCLCLPGHPPLQGHPGVCSGCGNGVVDENSTESCDGGAGCVSCVCSTGYLSSNPVGPACLAAVAPARRGGSEGLIVGVVVGGCFLILIAIAVAIAVYVVASVLYRLHSRHLAHLSPLLLRTVLYGGGGLA